MSSENYVCVYFMKIFGFYNGLLAQVVVCARDEYAKLAWQWSNCCVCVCAFVIVVSAAVHHWH